MSQQLDLFFARGDSHCYLEVVCLLDETIDELRVAAHRGKF